MDLFFSIISWISNSWMFLSQLFSCATRLTANTVWIRITSLTPQHFPLYARSWPYPGHLFSTPSPISCSFSLFNLFAHSWCHPGHCFLLRSSASSPFEFRNPCTNLASSRKSFSCLYQPFLLEISSPVVFNPMHNPGVIRDLLLFRSPNSPTIPITSLHGLCPAPKLAEVYISRTEPRFGQDKDHFRPQPILWTPPSFWIR